MTQFPIYNIIRLHTKYPERNTMSHENYNIDLVYLQDKYLTIQSITKILVDNKEFIELKVHECPSSLGLDSVSTSQTPLIAVAYSIIEWVIISYLFIFLHYFSSSLIVFV